MNDLQRNISKMCWIYLAFSLLYYFALPLVIFAPFLVPFGFQSPYHMFLLFLILGDGPAFPGKLLIVVLCLGGAIVMILLFLALLLIAIFIRQFAPLGWLMIINNLITVVVVALVLISYPSMYAIVFLALPGIIGNALFVWLYFRFIKKLDCKQNIEAMND